MTGAVAYLFSPLPSCTSPPVNLYGARRRIRPPLVCCAKGVTSNPDDYHATVKALNSRGRVPRKSLGQVPFITQLCLFDKIQHFLIFIFDLQHYMLNNDINEQLVAAAGVKDGDVVMEIGPGTGSLTNVLLNAGATVLAIEKVSN